MPHGLALLVRCSSVRLITGGFAEPKRVYMIFDMARCMPNIGLLNTLGGSIRYLATQACRIEHLVLRVKTYGFTV